MNLDDVLKHEAEGLQPWYVVLAWPDQDSESDTFGTTVWAKDDDDAIDQCKCEMLESCFDLSATAEERSEYKERISSNAIDCYPLAPCVCRDLGAFGIQLPEPEGQRTKEVPQFITLLREIQSAGTNKAALEAGVKLVTLLRLSV